MCIKSNESKLSNSQTPVHIYRPSSGYFERRKKPGWIEIREFRLAQWFPISSSTWLYTFKWQRWKNSPAPEEPRLLPQPTISGFPLKSNYQHLRLNRRSALLLLLYRAPCITSTSNPASDPFWTFWICEYFTFEGLLPKTTDHDYDYWYRKQVLRSSLVSERTPQYLRVRPLWWVIPPRSTVGQVRAYDRYGHGNPCLQRPLCQKNLEFNAYYVDIPIPFSPVYRP